MCETSSVIPASLHLCFCLYGDHRDLHSFPTRRSSDLADGNLRRPGLSTGNQAEIALIRRGGKWALASTRSRSEEHTSELQSRQYLVCRLLLEKKKSPASRTSPSASPATAAPAASAANC